MVVAFIAIVVTQLKRLPFLGAALIAGIFSYQFKGLPYQLGLLCSVAIGIAAGLALLHVGARIRHRRAGRLAGNHAENPGNSRSSGDSRNSSALEESRGPKPADRRVGKESVSTCRSRVSPHN